MAQVLKSVQKLLEASLRTIGELAAGETADTDALADSLEAFQDMLAEQVADSLFIPFFTWSSIPLTANDGTVKVGQEVISSPDLTAYPPAQILEAFVRDTDENDWPVKVMGYTAYADIQGKWTNSHTTGRPKSIWFNPTAPNVTIWLEPWPTAEYATLHILHTKPIEEPISLSLDLVNAYFIPRYYHNPLKWMLAVELCTEFGREPTQLMVTRASVGYHNLIGLNAANRVQEVPIDIPGGATGNYNETIMDS